MQRTSEDYFVANPDLPEQAIGYVKEISLPGLLAISRLKTFFLDSGVEFLQFLPTRILSFLRKMKMRWTINVYSPPY